MITIIIFGLFFNNYYLASFVSCRINGKIKIINDSLSELKKLDLKFISQPLQDTSFYLNVRNAYLLKIILILFYKSSYI